MVVVDSSVWIDYFSSSTSNNETNTLHALLETGQVLVGDLILTEVLQGFRTDRDRRNARRLMTAFTYRDIVGREIALKSAENYHALRKKGLTVRKTNDCLIATFCIEYGHVLLHRDSDFRPFEQMLGLNNAPAN